MEPAYPILTPDVVAALEPGRCEELGIFALSIELCESVAAVIRWVAVDGDGSGAYVGPRPVTPSELRLCERACLRAPDWLAERMRPLIEQFTEETALRSARYRALLAVLNPGHVGEPISHAVATAPEHTVRETTDAPVHEVETDEAALTFVAMARRAHAALRAAGAYQGSERDALTDIRAILQEAGVLELLDAYHYSRSCLASVAAVIRPWEWSELARDVSRTGPF